MEISEIKKRIEYCIEKIYTNDSDLFERNNYEVTISAKLAQYLFIEFKEYDVDCEYNKHLNEIKHSEDLNQDVRPDVVIHKRSYDEDNLVYIEIKKEQNTDSREPDREKIKAVTKQDGEYGYLLGIFIDFTVDSDQLIIEYYQNGAKLSV